MLKIFNDILLCIRIAYWYKYTDDLKDSGGHHISSFMIFTSFAFTFCIGVFGMLLVTLATGKNDTIAFFLDKPISIPSFLMLGAYITYLICIKNKQYLLGKDFMNSKPVDSQNEIGRKYFLGVMFLAVSSQFGFIIVALTL